MLPGADEAVPVVGLPDGAGLVLGLVYFFGGEAFKRMNDVGEGVITDGAEQKMDVVRHDDEGVEMISLAIEMLESMGNNLVVPG